ncbi:MAG TPA: hypothetical protein VME43_11770 [Bryobacteraceae bacterium]|nr:hypothetical protein [Bryobacteraceae bacterium]
MPLRILAAALVALAASLPATAQLSAEDPVTVATAHPRLLLTAARLRLLTRERQRKSARWQQLETLITGGAAMPERAFAQALYFRISGDQAIGKQAIAWALGPGDDLRQLALVFDWCQDLLTEAQKRDLAARIQKRMVETAADESVSATRSRVFAAIALFDDVPDAPQRELERVVRQWWLGKLVPAIKQGRSVIARDDAYALYELLHALRDNTLLDLREPVPEFFKDFPIQHLVSYYPATYQGPDADYYIGAEAHMGEPDLRVATLSRAAEMAMVAYDSNSNEAQVLQGFLMHDHYMLRGPFGAPYEFLWANPYQPGLSYYLVPLVYYNPDFGTLFVRSTWEDNATWFGRFDGVMQLFQDGSVAPVNLAHTPVAISLKEAMVWFAPAGQRITVKLDEEQAVFIVGLEPHRTYLVEVDDEEMQEAEADSGGTVELLDVPHGYEVGIRFREAKAASR